MLKYLIVAVMMLAAGEPPTTQKASCTCEAAKLKNAWCEACSVGYIAGLPVRYRELHEVMDAHGHDIDPDAKNCDSCRAAMQSVGFCEKCDLGFVNGQLYFSRLTYLVARGRQSDPSKLDCPICRKNSEKFGWCDQCGRGMVGNVGYTTKDLHSQACKEYGFLLAALDVAKRCELCACCMFTGATCPKCNIAHRRGQLPVPASQPEPAGEK